MKPSKRNWLVGILCVVLLFMLTPYAVADDTCIFSTTADDVPPNIVILLDNGAEMEYAVWHASYNNKTDYTPSVIPQTDVVANAGVGNGFFDNNGYGIVTHGGNYYLVPIAADLELGSSGNGILADSSDSGAHTGTWTINGRTITLPAEPSSAVDADGIKDNATSLRYSKNYLNWIFFSAAFLADTAGDGSDLPAVSRFYYAKSSLLTVAKATENRAKFGVHNFTSNSSGSSNVQPLGLVVSSDPLEPDWNDNVLDANYINNINNMGTVTYSPLAEGLANVGGYFNSPSSGVADSYCQKQFVIVVSPGASSEDQAMAANSVPAMLSDYDVDGFVGDSAIIFEDEMAYAIPTNQNGSTYLDDIAYYLYSNDIVGYINGHQNIMTYTVGFMASAASNLFLINTSNNGNGNVNLYDTSDVEYGDYHFAADNPASLSTQLLAAITDIISRNTTFTAPVVPVTRTTSGNRIYLALFKPTATSFWEGNVVKFGLNSNSAVVDKNGDPATYDNGAIREDVEPYWATEEWADPTKDNYIHNQFRNIYTYLGSSNILSHATNAFVTTNSSINSGLLGKPASTVSELVNFIRGGDVFDEDGDMDTTENRAVITGDVLHSEPVVVEYNSSTRYVFFGANDGMLHAVDDSDGSESWAFIPPDLLPNLKNLLEGTGHQNFVDSSPKVYTRDVNRNGIIEGDGDEDGDGLQDDMDGDGDIDSDDADRVILVCGERKGGTGYFALDITYPTAPVYLWRINQKIPGGTLQLSGITGTFQNDEPLTVKQQYATTNGIISEFLPFDNIVSSFTVDTTVTGQTSGATGTIVATEDNGAQGLLELSGITGTFQNNEGLLVSTRLATIDSPLFDYLLYEGADPADFPVGSHISGSTSGATATVTGSSADPFNLGSSFGFLELHDTSGTFQWGENILLDANQAAADGTDAEFLGYDAQTGTFTVGMEVLGATSGATGMVDNVDDLGGNMGILRFSSTSGTFSDNELLTVNTQLATVDGTLVSDALQYDSQSDILLVGDTINGATSGASGTISTITTTGVGSGILDFSGVSGAFQDNEALNTQASAASVNGTLFSNGLFYDARTSNNINKAKKLIGVTSGAQADIVDNIDLGGGEGFMVLANIVGTFQNNEELINNSKSIAFVNGSLLTNGLLFDNQTRAFAVGMTISGQTSGATALVTSLPAAGIVGVGSITGTFQDNETILILTQVALANGTLFDFLKYDAKTTSFTVGSEVSGDSSGAVGTIQRDIDLGSNTGALVFSSLTGAFVNNEGIMLSGQMATAYGTLFDGLRYDAKTTDFHVGEVVSGGTSAATATISDVINAGSTAGILVFSGPATGSFQDNEALLVDTLVAVAKNFVPDAIKYDAKVGNINNGDVVTGATSGHSGTVTAIGVLTPTTGLLALSGPTGSFVQDEGLIGGSAVAAATVNGQLFDGVRYDDMLTDFSAGMIIEGQASGDTATVDSITKTSFTDGVLELSAISGTFQDNEILVSSTDITVATSDGILDGSFLGYDNLVDTFTVGAVVTGSTSGAFGTITADALAPAPEVQIPELGESWAEPVFGVVKTMDDVCSITATTYCSENADCPDGEVCNLDTGTPVFFIGAGYGTSASSGKAVLAINVADATVEKKFSGIIGMDYFIPSSVKAIDADSNGFTDKVYVGDLGGQIWRFGQFTADAAGDTLWFPETDENINNWDGKIMFVADTSYTNSRTFYYPPSVTLEVGYDIVFIGTGDREDPCDESDPDGTTDSVILDRFYAVKDVHSSTALNEGDLVDITDPSATLPDFDATDNGWYLQLGPNEKVQAQSTVLFKALYFTTFTPNNDPCQPGGVGKLYAMNYKTAAAVLDLDTDDGTGSLERSVDVGGGIPSRPVIIIPDDGAERLIISVGSTNPDDTSLTVAPGIVDFDVFDPDTFYYLWWKEVID